MDEDIKRIEPTGKRGGEWITFGAEQYRVPPLSFGSIKAMQERISGMAGIVQGAAPSSDQMDAVLDVVHAALVRNYPEMPREQVADMVDLGNFAEVLGAVVRIAGFKAQAGGPQGEAPASTGTSSTQT